MTETDKAKAYLNRYKFALKRVEIINMRISELRYLAIGTGIQYSDMPKAHNQTDLSTFASKLDELEREWERERVESLEILREITETLKSMENQLFAQILEMRYIYGLRWETIADKTDYSVRNILIMHGKALTSLAMQITEVTNE